MADITRMVRAPPVIPAPPPDLFGAAFSFSTTKNLIKNLMKIWR